MADGATPYPYTYVDQNLYIACTFLGQLRWSTHLRSYAVPTFLTSHACFFYDGYLVGSGHPKKFMSHANFLTTGGIGGWVRARPARAPRGREAWVQNNYSAPRESNSATIYIYIYIYIYIGLMFYTPRCTYSYPLLDIFDWISTKGDVENETCMQQNSFRSRCASVHETTWSYNGGNG
jgi:hypothetical protein